MAYTALRNGYGTLTGTVHPIDYGSGRVYYRFFRASAYCILWTGIEWIDGLIERFPNSAIQVGLWIYNQCSSIASGSQDDQIEAFAAYVLQRPSYFYIRVGYEFDSSQNRYDPEEYVAAFQRIVNIFRNLSVRNAAFVWHATGEKPRDALVSRLVHH